MALVGFAENIGSGGAVRGGMIVMVRLPNWKKV
jgi:hypothetical protein